MMLSLLVVPTESDTLPKLAENESPVCATKYRYGNVGLSGALGSTVALMVEPRASPNWKLVPVLTVSDPEPSGRLIVKPESWLNCCARSLSQARPVIRRVVLIAEIETGPATGLGDDQE